MSDKKAKIPGTPPPADQHDDDLDEQTVLKVARISSIYFDYPPSPKAKKIVSDQKSLIHYYKDGTDEKKRKGDSELENQETSKKKSSPIKLDHSSDNSVAAPTPNVSSHRFDPLFLLWRPLPKKSKYFQDLDNQICRHCRQKCKFCHDRLFSDYARACVKYYQQFVPVELMGDHEMATKIFRKAYNRALKYYTFRMSKDVYHLPESNFHLPRCMMHTLECITDKMSDHEEWILRGHYTLDYLHPAGLCLKAEEFVCTKSEYADHDPTNLPKDICPYCRFSTKNKECYAQLFSEYCKTRVKNVYLKYAKAMEPMMVKKVYCTIFNGALHFYNFRCFEVLTRMTLHLPPKCLNDEMTEVIANITNDRDDYMESFVDEDLYDWKDTGKVLQYIGEDI